MSSDTAAASRSTSSVEVVPQSIYIGAEIRNVDLTQPLSTEEVRDIRDALLKWKVVFFRDQHLNHRQHIDFGRQFGELTPAHVVYGAQDPTYPEMYSVAKHRVATQVSDSVLNAWHGWHTDLTAAVNPPAASILRGDVVPPYGGDTMFADMMTAYRKLSPLMREFVDGLRAIHSFDPPSGAKASADFLKAKDARELVSEHPLVRVHPETGERALYVSPGFIKSIVGLTPTESRRMLDLLCEHAVRNELTVRFKWEPGSIAFWDNRSTAHLAPTDIFESNFDRQFYRVTVLGDVPVGVDGVASRSIDGEPIPSV